MAFVVRWNAVNATAFCDVAEAIENIDLRFEGHWMAVALRQTAVRWPSQGRKKAVAWASDSRKTAAGWS